MKMVIDLEVIANDIQSAGLDLSNLSYNELPDGWTNAICDSLVENYDIEGEIIKLLLKRSVK